ncbi:hypothetical protein ACJ41O_010956 [Fusarium nematophilum]
MARRKAANPLRNKKTVKKEGLPTTFSCLFCPSGDSVTVVLRKKDGVGHLRCRKCKQSFRCSINYLSKAVDVYGDWVDAAEAVAREEA